MQKILNISLDILRSITLCPDMFTCQRNCPFLGSQMLIFLSINQTNINLLLISLISPSLQPLAGVWEDTLQRLAGISQVFTTPSPSLKMAIPSLTHKLIDEIKGEAIGVDTRSITTRSADETPICQNLTNLLWDAEMRVEGEENAREVTSLVWPIKISIM